LSTKEANSIWMITPYSSYFGNSKLFVNQKNFRFSKERKKIFTEGFLLATKQGPLSSEPLHNLNFYLRRKSMSNQDPLTSLNFPSKVRRIMHWLLLKNKPIIQSPYFFCEIIFPSFLYFGIVHLINNLQKGKLFSIKRFLSQNLIVIRTTFPVALALDVESKIKTFSQGSASCFFQFDGWGEKNLSSSKKA